MSNDKPMTEAEFTSTDFAFPSTAKFGDLTVVNHGAKLRDYFAAKAMQAIIQSSATKDETYISNSSYSYADAMLEARELTITSKK